ncbi:hypothetical protein Leryth_019447 [Lithospermum erythrorhizon]|nr:hypothetical protein Leryth_019447 [Lithospermum erythrorhizon]
MHNVGATEDVHLIAFNLMVKGETLLIYPCCVTSQIF